MSDAIALDLLIQDFIKSNRLCGSSQSWETIVSRRVAESTPTLRVFGFNSGGVARLAVATYMALPDKDCIRLEFTHHIPPTADHRFEYLNMTSAKTHTQITHTANADTVHISLITRHRGYIDVEIIIRNGEPLGAERAAFC